MTITDKLKSSHKVMLEIRRDVLHSIIAIFSDIAYPPNIGRIESTLSYHGTVQTSSCMLSTLWLRSSSALDLNLYMGGDAQT